MTPTKSRCARGRPDATRHCTVCGPNVVEDLSHILQACPRTHGARIMRHDHILSLLSKRLRMLGWEARPELRIETSAGLRKPDLLVFRPGDQAWVIDVSIVSDTYDDLDIPFRSKVEKYKSRPEITASIEAELGLVPEFSAFILSWRGDYSPETAKDCKLLGLKKDDLCLISAACAERGAMVHRIHQKSNVVRFDD